jgi:hypothetical protein
VVGVDLSGIVEFLKMLFAAAEWAFRQAFSSPINGMIIGGFLWLLGKMSRALEAAGLLVIAVAAAVLVARLLGLQLPWPS